MARDLYVRESEVKLLRSLLAEGRTTRECAEEMGRCLRTIARMMKQHKLKSKHLQFGKRYRDPSGVVWTMAGGKIVRAKEQRL